VWANLAKVGSVARFAHFAPTCGQIWRKLAALPRLLILHLHVGGFDGSWQRCHVCSFSTYMWASLAKVGNVARSAHFAPTCGQAWRKLAALPGLLILHLHVGRFGESWQRCQVCSFCTYMWADLAEVGSAATSAHFEPTCGRI